MSLWVYSWLAEASQQATSQITSQAHCSQPGSVLKMDSLLDWTNANPWACTCPTQLAKKGTRIIRAAYGMLSIGHRKTRLPFLGSLSIGYNGLSPIKTLSFLYENNGMCTQLWGCKLHLNMHLHMCCQLYKAARRVYLTDANAITCMNQNVRYFCTSMLLCMHKVTETRVCCPHATDPAAANRSALWSFSLTLTHNKSMWSRRSVCDRITWIHSPWLQGCLVITSFWQFEQMSSLFPLQVLQWMETHF